MILIGGGGGGIVLLVLLFFLLAGGGSNAFPLVLMLAFFAVPFLLIRSFARRATPVPVGDGWDGGPGWQPLPQESAWEPPAEPVLPAVTAADVSSLRDRLGHDVSTLQPGEDPVARQAMADASERYSTASTLLERAGSDAQLRTAWLAAVEGLAAARVVRERLGLDPGPPVPQLPSAGPQLTRHARIDIEGRSHVGAPTYEPGRPHWFPGGYYGGRHVPGGWYDVPFWPSGLVLGALGGWALGGLLAGAMYGEDVGFGGGWDGGWDGGGFGGFGGGGDLGGGDFGGGDFGGGGGFGGGGDFGGFGGGGDFGGGDFGGGGDW